jgi:hypothetical protein
MLNNESRIPAYLSLFASVSTLLCCALPSVLVILGLGATVASTLTSVPWLVTLSRHKTWVFAGASLLFGVNLYYLKAIVPRLQARGAGCPPDEQEACERVRRQSRVVLWFSGGLLAIGFAVAYVLPAILARVEQ